MARALFAVVVTAPGHQSRPAASTIRFWWCMALAAAVDRLVRAGAEHGVAFAPKAAEKILNVKKNSIKHVNKEPGDLWVEVDPELEAWSMLTRAAENFETLDRPDLSRPPLLDAFRPTLPTLRAVSQPPSQEPSWPQTRRMGLLDP